ncbi:hypothetical protein [Polaribacter filamentus]|nr:hypothetical protein [Polaribacter filamentus]
MVSLPVTKGGGSKMYGKRSLEVLKRGESDLNNSRTWVMITFKRTLQTSK